MLRRCGKKLTKDLCPSLRNIRRKNMSRPKVYLSGPISGCDWNECTSWRDYVESELKEFKCLSPLRGKSYLKKAGRITDKTSLQNTPGYKDVLSSDQAIMVRDSHDTLNSDAIFVNLLGTTKISIGTIF